MIFVIGAISVASLVLNILIFRMIKEKDALITFQEITGDVIEPTEERICEAEDIDKPLPPVTVPMVQDVYNGWRNQSGIPWTDNPSSPSKPTQPKVRGPLERPDGFV